LEFLQLSIGHNYIKDDLKKVKPKVSSDMGDNRNFMKLSGNVSVVPAETNFSLRDQHKTQAPQMERQNFNLQSVIGRDKPHALEKKSSDFRTAMFFHHGRSKDNSIYNQR